VLAPVVVELEGDPPAREDRDLLDLEGRPPQQHRIHPPGAVHCRMEVAALVSFRLERLYDLADALSLSLRTDEEGVGGVDDRYVGEADRRHKAVGDDQVVPPVDADVLALHGVARVVLLAQTIQGVKAPDIAPRTGEWDDRGAVGPLHDPVVDRDLRCLRVRLLDWQGKGVGDLRCQTSALLHEEGGAEEEHPGVPEVSLAHVALCSLSVRFLDECSNGIASRKCFARHYIAKAGVWGCRRDPEGDQVFLRESLGRPESRRIGIASLDELVGGEHGDGVVPTLAQDRSHAADNRREGVLPLRLSQDAAGRTDLGELVGHQKAVRNTRDHVDLFGAGEEEGPPHAPLEERLFAEEGDELFRVAGPAQGEEAGARTACKDDRLHGGVLLMNVRKLRSYFAAIV